MVVPAGLLFKAWHTHIKRILDPFASSSESVELNGTVTVGCAPVLVWVASRPVDVSTDLPGGIRMMGADQRFSDVSIQSVARRARDRRGEAPFSILALSGGGADAAFGAGALMGLAQAGERPQFSVVTGVSAGALLAPYAFLGPEWDQQLMDANDRGEPVSRQGIGCPTDDEFIGRFAVRKAAPQVARAATQSDQ